MKLLLVCEGEGDEEDLRTLTLRVLHESHDWLVGLEALDEPTPSWLEFETGRRFLKWSNVAAVCDGWKVPPVQRLGRGLGYRAALRALRLLSALPTRPLAEGVRVVMVHDSDRVDGWVESLELARDEWRAAVGEASDADAAVGVAHPEHEAWALAAFEARDDGERARLKDVRQRLGFDPTAAGERLTSTRETSPKDAKRALREVCPDEERRGALMWEVPLDTLRTRGREIGLTAFLDELKKRVASGY